jgi:predicted amidohydrolase YtcJ
VDEITAGTVFLDGRILTLDPRRPTATALAVADGRIVAVGGAADVKSWRGRQTHVVSLRGASVIPGLVDAHAHLDREGLKRLSPSLARCRSIADVQQVIRRLAAHRKPGEWIVTMPVGTPPFYQDAPSGLAEQRWPTRLELDSAAPHHPVYVRGIWGYWNRPQDEGF